MHELNEVQRSEAPEQASGLYTQAFDASNDNKQIFNNSANTKDLEDRGLLPAVALVDDSELTDSANTRRPVAENDIKSPYAGPATDQSHDAMLTTSESPASNDTVLDAMRSTASDTREPDSRAMQQIRTLSNSGSYTGYSAEVEQSLREMHRTHGPEGFRNMIDTLEQLGQGDFSFYRHDLRQSNYMERDNMLSNLERLCDPAVAQQVQELNRTMRAEGYTQNISLSELTPQFIDMMRNQPEQRAAFIEFNNESRHTMAPAVFLQQQPEILDALPSQQLRLYRIWQQGQLNQQ